MRYGDEIYQDFSRILLTRDEIRCRVQELGRQITEDYYGKLPVVLSVLRGSVVFLSDLIREIKTPMMLDFIAAASYGNNDTTSGKVNITKDTSISLEGKDVLIVEDIVDTGLTMQALMKILKNRGARSVRLAVLLDKAGRREVDNLKADYVGFEVPNEFLVGYGLDFCDMYRNLPDIAVLRDEAARETQAEMTKRAEDDARRITQKAVL